MGNRLPLFSQFSQPQQPEHDERRDDEPLQGDEDGLGGGETLEEHFGKGDGVGAEFVDVLATGEVGAGAVVRPRVEKPESLEGDQLEDVAEMIADLREMGGDQEEIEQPGDGIDAEQPGHGAEVGGVAGAEASPGEKTEDPGIQRQREIDRTGVGPEAAEDGEGEGEPVAPAVAAQRQPGEAECQGNEQQHQGVAARLEAVVDVHGMNGRETRGEDGGETEPPELEQPPERGDGGEPGEKHGQAQGDDVELLAFGPGKGPPQAQAGLAGDAQEHGIVAESVFEQGLLPAGAAPDFLAILANFEVAVEVAAQVVLLVEIERPVEVGRAECGRTEQEKRETDPVDSSRSKERARGKGRLSAAPAGDGHPPAGGEGADPENQADGEGSIPQADLAVGLDAEIQAAEGFEVPKDRARDGVLGHVHSAGRLFQGPAFPGRFALQPETEETRR